MRYTFRLQELLLSSKAEEWSCHEKSKEINVSRTQFTCRQRYFDYGILEIFGSGWIQNGTF